MSNRQVNGKQGTGRPHDRGEGGGAVDQPGVDDIQDSVNGVQMASRPASTTAPTMELGTHLPFQSEFILDDCQPDLALRSSDDAIFWTHRIRLDAVSQNAFDGLLDTYSKDLTGLDPVVPLPISSSLLSVVLYTIYDLPFPITLNDLQLSTLLDALSVLKTYGIPLDHFIVPARSLYEAILAETPSNPMEVYITAAENRLEALAVASSAHLLSFDLTTVTDDMAVRMGARYFRRLIALQVGRVDRLKVLLTRLPRAQPDHEESCSFAAHNCLEAGWVLTVASLVPELRADFPADLLQMRLSCWEDNIPCNECRATLQARVRQVITKWSSTSVTI